MDEQAYYERLPTTADDPDDLFEHFETRSVAGRTHHILPDERHGLERGTTLVPEADAVVRGYPSTRRILVLEDGIHELFDADETVVVEEKLNGFNVRIGDVGEPLALTRSGYVCPYTTARAKNLLDLGAFFGDHPDKMLCGELIGPESPYTVHEYEDIDTNDLRIFGIRDRESGEPVSLDRRAALCETYGFDQPRTFARCAPPEAVEASHDAIAELDEGEREGIVLKRPDGELVTKYATESQIHNDLEYAFSIPFEAGQEFIFSRVVRDAFQAVEFGESDERLEERSQELGEAILRPLVETIRAVEVGEPVGERHTVRGDPQTIERLLEHLRGQGLHVDVQTDTREAGDRVVEFLKIDQSSRDRIDYYLNGGTRDE